MSQNRKALLRYRVLDKCFADKHNKYFINDLVERVNDALEDAAILPMLAMQYPQKQEENALVKNWFWIRWKKQKNLIF